MKTFLRLLSLTALLFLATLASTLSYSKSSLDFYPNLVNGEIVPKGMFDDVGSLSMENSGCTATVIGPRAILTAGHCALNNDDSASDEFQGFFTDINGVEYSVTYYRSPYYRDGDFLFHDIMIGIADREIKGISPATIASSFKIGDEITLVGRGCTDLHAPNGTIIDGLPRYGKTTIDAIDSQTTAILSHKGVFLCSGDSGGPAFLNTNDGYHLVIGVASTGSNNPDSPENGHARMDHKLTSEFLTQLTQSTHVLICGFNHICGPYHPVTN